MIKFINQIDNLLIEIINNDKLVLIFYEEHCHNSKKIVNIINNYDLDIETNIILINKNLFLQKNYNKLEKQYFKYFIQNNSMESYYNLYFDKIIENMSFLFYNEIMDLETPHFYFIKKLKNKLPQVIYHSVYYANLDHSNNFIKMINNFNNKKEIKDNLKEKFINNYVLEEFDIELLFEEVKKIKIFI